MGDEYLVDEGSGAIVPYGSDRPLPSQLRTDPRHVEPVRIEVDADTAAVTETVHDLRDRLVAQYGFAPREIDVVAGRGGWRLLVDGEVVDSSPKLGHDSRESLYGALARNLWRMLTTDDAAELVAFARIQSPAAIDRAMPRQVSLELLRGVLRRLLREQVPIKPLDRIVEVLATAPHPYEGMDPLVERVRLARRRTIVESQRQTNGALRVVDLSDGAVGACMHLGQPHEPESDRRRRFLDRMRRDVEGARAEHRLAPVVVACEQWVRPFVASVLRELDVRVLGLDELAGFDATTVAQLGEGIHVPAWSPPMPPPPDAFGNVWSDRRTVGQQMGTDRAMPMPMPPDIVDVEIIE